VGARSRTQYQRERRTENVTVATVAGYALTRTSGNSLARESSGTAPHRS
jgi:hypothetical protein